MPTQYTYCFIALACWTILFSIGECVAQSPVRHYSYCDNSRLPATDLPEIDPPLPHFVVISRDTSPVFDGMITLGKDYLLTVVPDANFLSSFPHDANYLISRVSLLKEVGEGAPVKIGSYKPAGGRSGEVQIPLSWFREELASGDRLWLAVDRVYRLNHERKKVWVRLPEHYLFIPLEIK